MRTITVKDALKEAIIEEMDRDENVFVMGEDIAEHGGIYGVTAGLLDKYGKERIRNTPISESALIGSALGAAITGMRPIAELMYIDFTTVAMDQIVNQAAKMRYMFGGKVDVPLVIRTQGGGGRGSAAQHSQSLEAWFMHVPGLKVVMPSTPYDAKGLLKTAIRDDNPVMFIEQKMAYGFKGEVPEEEYLIPFGQADIKREGSDVTLVANSYLLPKALKAAEMMEKEEGIKVEVIDPLTLVPFDEETIIKSVSKTGRLIVVHEAVKRGGFGAEIAAKIFESDAFYYLDAPLQRVAGLDVPTPYNEKLENFAMPDLEDIKEAIKKTCYL
ncbi:alpha-ketoacid dehydrogenase subunit beta [Halanaerobium sp. Z-7514]|uniref:Alpha-ketoacid dehydrogenase subunit beta n=1 Tax=Halanaerobium polyolivorans TaxID=2886943 RepID=A0AAW4X240_9FIRM|nr:alpha-ketoacid dehydrogenase subunit beta [Halanaerobium polyolivorans]MCC3145827.1 alpha-ketoacid dehydrogenase subunit beta [Halanaerobium polyolivorans]RQD76603.1 MAG: alpha-ketoacid dehydrogenase subunit beta [Halanaerobium sp. MSAO_Bac5]